MNIFSGSQKEGQWKSDFELEELEQAKEADQQAKREQKKARTSKSKAGTQGSTASAFQTQPSQPTQLPAASVGQVSASAMSQTQPTQPTQLPATHIFKCSLCMEPGHRANYCPTSKQSPTLNGGPAGNELMISDLVNSSMTKSDIIVQDQKQDEECNDLFTSDISISDMTKSNIVVQDQNQGEEDCPFCGDPLPSEPSDKLRRLKAALLAMPNASSLSFPQTAEFCDLHRNERDIVPLGIREGWPTAINFEILDKRIQKHANYLTEIINKKTTSKFLDDAMIKWKKMGRHNLLDELSKHAKDHEKLIAPTPTQTSMRTRRGQSFGEEVVQDMLFRLDHDKVQCDVAYWMRMPYMGFVVAGAYDRPTLS
ncbi:hypothetical protein DFH28DRAFT_924617 [Melampsora americana]|nr:hypothetical protein DFH28DRAFT_924617 [Melampsora americana]